ncbi:DUF6445 family protein [Povalibacter sp.]|uniref:DUF6445 family protein n=1 Tax=Povalibacter sp. TaxID=1962978 RepID=UPI002F40B069
MILDLNPDFRIEQLTVGAEKAPLLVIDNFVADPQRLVRRAAARQFRSGGINYPGMRTEAPLAYQQLFRGRLQRTLFDFFGLTGRSLAFPMCHYSLVTTPAAQLKPLQRIPHVDSTDGRGLATVHYLFEANLGGTAFYRHRATGFESIDASRKEVYYQHIEQLLREPQSLPAGYINSDTDLFQQIASVPGVFNRILIYRRNSLHSGSIDKDFVPDADPLTGRLSINCFIDPVA